MKILSSYIWNNHRYCVVLMSDGTRCEIKGDLKMADETALDKAEVIENLPKLASTVSIPSIKDYSDAELVAETKLRGLTVTADVKLGVK